MDTKSILGEAWSHFKESGRLTRKKRIRRVGLIPPGDELDLTDGWMASLYAVSPCSHSITNGQHLMKRSLWRKGEREMVPVGVISTGSFKGGVEYGMLRFHNHRLTFRRKGHELIWRFDSKRIGSLFFNSPKGRLTFSSQARLSVATPSGEVEGMMRFPRFFNKFCPYGKFVFGALPALEFKLPTGSALDHHAAYSWPKGVDSALECGLKFPPEWPLFAFLPEHVLLGRNERLMAIGLALWVVTLYAVK